MKNLHITHPEDLVFDGKDAVQNVIEVFRSAFDDYNQERNSISVKYDGAPAIVFGTDVTNGRFFVGTKSVFNKNIKKICYTHACIDYYYSSKDSLATILKLCLDYLPRVGGVYQADFIGLGDGNLDEFTPNTITYKFDKSPTEDIIMAMHTAYVGSDFDDMIAVPQYGITMPGLHVKWIDERVEHNDKKLYVLAFEAAMRSVVDKLELIGDDFPEFKSKAAKARVLKYINTYVRANDVIDIDELVSLTDIDERVFELYLLIMEAKEILINRFEPVEDCTCYVNGVESEHEGLVVTNFETCKKIKLVRRYSFSRNNFNNSKFAVAQ